MGRGGSEPYGRSRTVYQAPTLSTDVRFEMKMYIDEGGHCRKTAASLNQTALAPFSSAGTGAGHWFRAA
jgi:hypothetical protein